MVDALPRSEPTWDQLPVETLLATGGDSRQVIDPVTGLSKYGCSMVPRPEVAPLGSCTASSISTGGYRAASELLDRLRAVDHETGPVDPLAEYFHNIREELRFHLTGFAHPDVDVVLCPSGTDVELLALALAHGDGSRPVTNVIVGPAEVGSGTVLAAGGRYFDTITPSGREVVAGEPVDERMAERTEVVTVEFREIDGTPREVDDLDGELSSLVDSRIAQGRTVLVHVTAHSKTGLHAPTLRCIRALKEVHGERVVVIIDAAQGRFSRRGLRSVLDAGHLVTVTSSKFYGGPPFAGALLVPPAMSPERRSMAPLPQSFDAFFAPTYFPESWRDRTELLRSDPSVGLLFRWTAGMHEVRRYYATHSTLRYNVLRDFEAAVPLAFSASKFASLEDTVERQLGDEVARVLQSKMTVFSVRLMHPDGSRFSLEELRTVWRWLNNDVSRLMADAGIDERNALARRFHVGQPVLLTARGEKPAVLRIALGGVLLSHVAQDLRWGDSYSERGARLSDELRGVREKLDVIATHFPALEASERTVAGLSS